MGQTSLRRPELPLGAMMATFLIAVGFGLSVPAFAQQPAPAQPIVDKLVLDDTIQPVSADELTRALDRANCRRRQRAADRDGHAGRAAGFNARHGRRNSALACSGHRVCGAVGGARGLGGVLHSGVGGRGRDGAGHRGRRGSSWFRVGGKPDSTEMQKVENDAEAFLRSYVTQAESQRGCSRGGRANRRTPTPRRKR